MVLEWKVVAGAIGVLYVHAVVAPDQASAITAELARTCRALTTKQFPPREIANPAAGSAKGSGRDQIAYFNKCVANNGKMDDGSK
ncbi:hypothetical protein [Bradyrhizobium sp.]|jgi:hypothetical protein|uniref:hypothetical protein n=1 Tax=Bradyrhizobium sp. TaxID=376 RepID=UPI002DDD7623|nr:hypothetical protein [Bradyrhizobium sp.]HEV2154473.1 hypothetical protein [Bradyrhizobium sp.]